jgi:hypothetical protein
MHQTLWCSKFECCSNYLKVNFFDKLFNPWKIKSKQCGEHDFNVMEFLGITPIAGGCLCYITIQWQED